MFIKRDTRKIHEILAQSGDETEVLKFSNRKKELDHAIKNIFHGALNLPKLRSLNLYDNEINSLQGIGVLSATPIEEINIGKNCIQSIPLEFGTLSNLKTLWIEDNEISAFPSAFFQLSKLEELKLSGNHISAIPTSIGFLANLKTLFLDNNAFEEFPASLLQVATLIHLSLRQNKIKFLPDDIDKLASLETLSISSNALTALPQRISNLDRLKNLYANGNKISSFEVSLASLASIKTINLANNDIAIIPVTISEAWGTYDGTSGRLTQANTERNDATPAKEVEVIMLGNPIIVPATTDDTAAGSMQED